VISNKNFITLDVSKECSDVMCQPWSTRVLTSLH